MKLSTITATSIVALAAAALIASGVSAAQNHNSSRSNKTYKIDAGNPDAEKQCIGKGGSVKDSMCMMPEGPSQPVEATTVKSSKSNSSERSGDTAGGSPQPAGSANLNLSKSNINRIGGTVPEPTEEKKICIIYKPGHEGDDRYCSQSVPAPN